MLRTSRFPNLKMLDKSRLQSLRKVLLVLACLLLVSSAATWEQWRRENALLRTEALRIVHDARNKSESIVALNHWVYRHQGFAKNHHYFLLKQLGPTPLQVFHAGGDCADKSRLLSVMLSQIGIPSSLIMVYPCLDCAPIHTVVEASYGRDWMVVDPIWDVDYPASGGRYYGVRELAGTSLGVARMAELREQNPRTAKIWRMDAADAVFDHATGINWRKNSLSRFAAAALNAMNVEPSSVRRPRIVEDPQLVISLLTLVLSACLFGAALLIST